MNAVLQAQGLCYRLGQRRLLDDLELAVYPGDCIALLGANGAGKSTLLRLLLGLLKPESGQVCLQGQPLTTLGRRQIARHLAYVPQSHAPTFPYSVDQVVLQGRLPVTGIGHAPAAADFEAVEHALHELGITHLTQRPYTELSGGERQLVLIARALVQEARVILLDEPVAGLDYGHQIRLLARLQKLAQQGLSIITTTHHPEHALASANRTWVLHDGRMIADGLPVEVIDAALIERLYNVRVRQIDLVPQRFFIPL